MMITAITLAIAAHLPENSPDILTAWSRNRMSFDTHYHAPSKKLWHGRADSPPGASFFQVIKLLDLNQPLPETKETLSFALLGFCCDEGIRRNLGRTGAAEGPDALRGVLAKLPLHRLEASIHDAGNIVCNDRDLESAQAALGQTVQKLLNSGYIPILIGGGHEIAWGHYQGIALQYPTAHLGIINIDTHFDMRPSPEHDQGSSGTPFLQIAEAHTAEHRPFDYHCIGIQPYGNTRHLFTTADRHQVKILSADEVHAHPDATEAFVKRALDNNQLIYLSLCLDVFSAAYAPGVSAPQAFGLTPWDILPVVRQVAASGKVVSYDIAELSPKYDEDLRTVKLTANFIYEIIHHHQPSPVKE